MAAWRVSPLGGSTLVPVAHELLDGHRRDARHPPAGMLSMPPPAPPEPPLYGI